MPAFIGPVEAPKHDVALVFADAGPRVGDAHDAFAVAVEQGKFHAPTFRREFHRVVDEVSNGLEKKIAIAMHGRSGADSDLKSDALFVRYRLIEIAHLPNEVCERDFAKSSKSPTVTIGEPAHGVAVLVGIGLVINGLTPALPISVAPSGIVPPFSPNVEICPGVDSGEAMPVEETPGEGDSRKNRASAAPTDDTPAAQLPQVQPR